MKFSDSATKLSELEVGETKKNCAHYWSFSDVELDLEKNSLLATVRELSRGDQRMEVGHDRFCLKIETQIELIDEILRFRKN